MTGSGAGEAISIRWGTGVIAGNIVTGKTRQGVKLWSAGSSDMNQVVSNKALRTTGLVSFLDEYRRLARNS